MNKFENYYDPDIPAPNVFLIGRPGTGKTTCVRTLVEQGWRVFVFALEAQTVRKLADLDKDLCKVCYVKEIRESLGAMLKQAEKEKEQAWSVTKSQTVDDNKAVLAESFWRILTGLENFVDSRTGEECGNLGDLPAGNAIVIDHLTNMSDMARNFVVGNPPQMSNAAIGRVQNHILQLVKFVCECNAMTVLIGHEKREFSEIHQMEMAQPITLGKALDDKIVAPFDEVVRCARKGDEFSWNTASTEVACKSSYLPCKNGLIPDFGPLIHAWTKKTQPSLVN